MESLAKCSIQGLRPDFCFQPKTVHPRESRPRVKDVRAYSSRASGQDNKLSPCGPKLPVPPLRLKTTTARAPPPESLVSTQLRNQRMAERRLKLGRTVDALREYFPHVLEKAWPQEILSEDVGLKDAISPHFGLRPFNAYGKQNYNRRMWFVRLYASLFCNQTKVQILRFWQPSKESVIIRWSMKLRPRVFHNIYGTTLQIDGISEIKLDRHGRVYEHRVDVTDRHKIKFDLDFQRFAQNVLREATVPVG